MELGKIRATISGVTQMTGKPFEITADFTVCQSNSDYGTGCYLLVEFADGGEAYCDVRYSGTRDVKKLATMWIRNNYGNRLTGYQFIDD